MGERRNRRFGNIFSPSPDARLFEARVPAHSRKAPRRRQAMMNSHRLTQSNPDVTGHPRALSLFQNKPSAGHLEVRQFGEERHPEQPNLKSVVREHRGRDQGPMGCLGTDADR